MVVGAGGGIGRPPTARSLGNDENAARSSSAARDRSNAVIAEAGLSSSGVLKASRSGKSHDIVGDSTTCLVGSVCREGLGASESDRCGEVGASVSALLHAVEGDGMDNQMVMDACVEERCVPSPYDVDEAMNEMLDGNVAVDAMRVGANSNLSGECPDFPALRTQGARYNAAAMNAGPSHGNMASTAAGMEHRDTFNAWKPPPVVALPDWSSNKEHFLVGRHGATGRSRG